VVGSAARVVCSGGPNPADLRARRHQELPWVRVDKEYRFETAEESASLAALFRGRSQLLVSHIMFGPDYTPAVINRENKAVSAEFRELFRIAPVRVLQALAKFAEPVDIAVLQFAEESYGVFQQQRERLA
jgi:hypothetical protein